MSERYTRVFDLPANMYAENAPVVISAGALLKDNQTGTILAQLKIKNITNKIIKAAKVSIISFDTAGNRIDNETVHEYLDLSVGRDYEFGQKVPVTLSNNSTRSFTVAVNQVIFADNSIWNCGNEEWSSLAEAKTLIAKLGDFEAVKQFKLEYGDKCELEATEDRDIWICSCGKINKKDEDNCFACGCSLQNLKNVDLTKLNDDKATRVTEEKAKEKKAETKRNKTIAIATVICVVIIIAATIFTNYNKKLNKYNYTVELLAPHSQDYAEGIDMLFELGDFKDSEELIYNKAVSFLDSSTDKVNIAVDALFRLGDYKDSKEQLYNKAIKLTGVSYSSDNINAGIDILTRLGDYKDSKEKIQETNYNQAMKLFDKGEFEEAVAEFKKLEGYKDSAEKVKEAKLNEFVLNNFLSKNSTKQNINVDLLQEYGGTELSGAEIIKSFAGSWICNISTTPQSFTFNADGSTAMSVYRNGSYWGTVVDPIMKWSVENDAVKTQSSYTLNGQSKDFVGSFKLIKMSDDVVVAYNPTSKLIMNIYIAKESNLAKICMKEYQNN